MLVLDMPISSIPPPLLERDPEVCRAVAEHLLETDDGLHWIHDDPLSGASTLLAGVRTTMRRVAYVAFLADLLPSIDLRSSCGIGNCVRPDHQELSPSRNSLSNPLAVGDLSVSFGGHRKPKRPEEREARGLYRTAFQKKLKSFVRGTKSAQGHWFPEAGAPIAVRPPGLGELVTFKRALYAAYVGDIAEGMELRSTCGVPQCYCPDHQDQVPSRSGQGRPLSLPDLDVSKQGYAAVIEYDAKFGGAAKAVLPRGLSPATVAAVNRNRLRGKTLQETALEANIRVETVVKIWNGIYDSALRANTRSISEAAEKRRRRSTSPSPPVIEPTTDPGNQTSGMTLEEAEWLKSVS